jgi:hypothetical protein
VWLLLVNAGALATWHRTAGTGTADEPGYQRMGLRALTAILSMDPNWAPAYALWYRALETIGLTGHSGFMATSIALSLSLSLLIYRYSLALSGNVVASLLAASIHAISFVNIGSWSKVGAASMVPVLPALIYGIRDGWSWQSRLALLCGVLGASYFRPEQMLGAVLVAPWLLAALWGPGRPRLPVACAATFGVAALVGALQATIGLPLVVPSGRSAHALSQHFALNWGRWTDYPGNTWLDHQQIWRDVFGTPVSLAHAFGANPPMMLRHLADNALGLIVQPLSMIFMSGAHILPVHKISASQVSGLALCAVLMSVAARSWPAVADRAWLRANLIPWGILVAPAIVTGLLIYPRHHTIAWISLILLLAMCAVIGRGSTDQQRLAAFAVAFTLSMAVGPWLLGAFSPLRFLRG